MAPKNDGTVKKGMNKGAWTAEEDRKLSQYIELHGPKRWKTIAIKAGLNRCGKSCRLRWLNYLRPNIKRGNISDEEEDLILRLHRLLGNRWSLIAGRLPGRTDNEIKNYWNSHLSKKLNRQREREEEEEEETPSTAQISPSPPKKAPLLLDHPTVTHEITKGSPHKTLPVTDDNIDVNELFDFTTGGSYGLDWVNKFLELDEGAWINEKSKWGRGL